MRSISLKAGLNPGFVYQLLKEGNHPGDENLEKIAAVLGLSLSEFTDKSEESDPGQARLQRIWMSMSKEKRDAFLDLAEAFASQRKRGR